MRTLDKIWENTQTEDEDKMMIDKKTKTGDKTMNDIMHNDEKMEKMPMPTKKHKRNTTHTNSW